MLTAESAELLGTLLSLHACSWSPYSAQFAVWRDQVTDPLLDELVAAGIVLVAAARRRNADSRVGEVNLDALRAAAGKDGQQTLTD